MRIVLSSFAATLLTASALLAGALVVEIGNPATNPEALLKHAALVARTTACHAPEKTSMTASAEGIIGGHRRSIPLKLIPLSVPGTFAITHEWPPVGAWAIKIVARNPEYKDYATGALVRFNGGSKDLSSVKHYFHEPTDSEIATMLDIRSSVDRASLK